MKKKRNIHWVRRVIGSIALVGAVVGFLIPGVPIEWLFIPIVLLSFGWDLKTLYFKLRNFY